jgi:hypothetical protein
LGDHTNLGMDSWARTTLRAIEPYVRAAPVTAAEVCRNLRLLSVLFIRASSCVSYATWSRSSDDRSFPMGTSSMDASPGLA